MVTIHENLLEISHQKTEEIKNSNTEQLIKLLTKEKKYIQDAEKKEKEREIAINDFFEVENSNITERTVTELLLLANDEKEKQLLENSIAKLIEIIVRLRESEQLNNGLLEQSMQFVQLTLSMLQPQTKTINYGGDRGPQKTNKNLSVFDSKA